jgi:hypothetical protein
MRPPFFTRLLFCLILGLFSTFFAEVVSASSPFVFFTPFGLIGTYPIYLLHTLVLGTLVIRRGKQVSLQALYFAGGIFGLYEAYITKVLWNPPWNTTPLRVVGISLLDTVVLVGFWHVFMSFIVPLFAAELFLLRSNRLMRSLPEKWQAFLRRPIAVWVIAGVMGLWQGIAAGQYAVISALANALVLLVFIFLWKRLTRDHDYEWQDLLPNRTEWIVLLVVLLGYYLVFGFGVRAGAIPGLGGQLTIWLMYIIWGVLLWLALKTAPVEMEPVEPAFSIPPMRTWLIFMLGFGLTSLVVSLLLLPVRDVAFGVVWVIGLLTGVVALVRMTVKVFNKGRRHVKTE